MSAKRGLCQDKSGRFVRNLGWKQTAKGYSQETFYLGRDESVAHIANLRLEQLCAVVGKR